MTRRSILAFVSAALVLPAVCSALDRFNVTLDGGTQFVTVDNDSSWSNAEVQVRVLAADRSTQDDCDYTWPDYKGLFQQGDRIYVNDSYMAWFDMTTDDGIAYPNPPFGQAWERSGALAGWWTMKPNAPDFKYTVQGPNGCPDWAPNELIPGAASPNREKHWWDKYGPPTEHSLVAVTASGDHFFGHHLSRGALNGQWALTKDGVETAAGVRYETTGRLASLLDHQVDVTDNNDANGIANTIESEIEYICKAKNIQVTWRFKPQSADVVTNNMFVYIWLNNAQDQDGTSCDPGGTGSQFPATVWRNYLHGQSNLEVRTNYDVGPFPPQTFFPMEVGECVGQPHSNNDARTYPDFAVADKSWIKVGESSTLARSKPRFRWRHLGVPNSGAGTQGNPFKIDWDRLIFWNETFDGTIGFGMTRGPYSNDPSKWKTLQAGKWYQARFDLRSRF